MTVPASPFTSTRAPSGIVRVAPVTETTHGTPSSRLTITAWLIWAPTSTTTAAAGTNSGVQAGSVMGATSTSPGWRPRGSPGSWTTRARPVATPVQPGMPTSTVPAAAGANAALRRGHSLGGGGSPWVTNGGSTSNSPR